MVGFVFLLQANWFEQTGLRKLVWAECSVHSPMVNTRSEVCQAWVCTVPLPACPS